MKIDESVTRWLTESDEPSVAFRTYRELLQRDASEPEIDKLKGSIAQSRTVQDIISRMHPEGYWLQQNPSNGELIGDGVEYGSFATTHFCLAYLAELGMDKSHPLIALASERYLGLQKPDGDWWQHMSCLYTYNIRTFVLLGYRDDPRVQQAVGMMLATERHDGGYLCDIHEGKKKRVKSCYRGAAKALMAFAELPEYWQHPRCIVLVNYFLARGGIYTMKDPNSYVNKDIERWSYPPIWRANLWEVMLALGKMGYGDDPRLKRAWDVLESRINSDGKVVLDWTPTQCPWKVGRRGQPNKWLTFYAYLALGNRLSENRP